MIAVAEIGNPFPGLRSFEREQAHLFFGRDQQIREVVQRLKAHRFVAIVGVSGSGKSSLIRAGLIPALTGRLIESERSLWRIGTLRPGRNPMTELAAALCGEFAEAERESVLSSLRESNAGLARIAAKHLGSEEKLLLLVDQFEELFRYRAQAKSTGEADESAAFVKLLLAAAGESEHPLPGLDTQPIYVVITMRSDFLGKCSRFRGLPEALNRCQYLVPRMSRDQQRDVIEGPVGMAGASVEPGLVQRLLNDWGDNPDQLPPLQHALMRTWEEAGNAQMRGQVLTVDHYLAIGGMADALNRDADNAFDALGGDEAERIARRLFQRLVEPGAPDEETRRPTALSEIVAVADAPPEKVLDVIKVFRERGFLTASNDEDPIIDITHESLIRNWKRLNEWIHQETRSAALYRRLVGTAELYSGTKRWLTDPELQLNLKWREEAKPNEAWGLRYQEAYGQAMNFLDQSREAHDKEIHANERERRRKLRRARLVATVLAGFLLLAIAASILAVVQWKRTQTERDRSRRLLYDANIYFANRAAAAGQFTQAQNRLNELLDPAVKDVRGFEWFHLWRVVHADEATLTGHADPVNSVAFSPDGKTLASASDDNTVKLWDIASRKELATLTGHAESVYSVTFSPDGKMLASASWDDTVKLWDTASRAELATLTGHSADVNSVAFSPDGKTLASASDDNTVKLWDTASGKELATLAGHAEFVFSVAFSPDGKTLASASGDKMVKLWDTASGKELATLAGHTESVYSVAFSPDGKTLASASGDKTVKLWDTASRKELATLAGHAEFVKSVAFSPDGETLASSGDKTVKLWDTASRKELATLAGHAESVYSVTFLPDGKTLASASGDKTVKLWDTASRRELVTLAGHAQSVSSVTFSPDGKTFVSASWDGTVKLWDTASRAELATLAGHTESVYSVAFSPDGKMLASASWDDTVKLWDTASRAELATLTGHAESVYSVTFSPDGKMLASASWDDTVKLWDTASRAELATLAGHAESVNSVAFSPDGKMLASASGDKTVKLWDIASRAELATLAGHAESVNSVAFSPDGKTLASASGDKTVKLWDTASGKELATLAGHAEFVFSVAFSPDGKTLASASGDKMVKLWDTASGKELATLAGHAESVRSVAFSPDGKTLASASRDRTVKLWFAATEEEVEARRRSGY